MGFWDALLGPTVWTHIFGGLLAAWVLVAIASAIGAEAYRYVQRASHGICLVIRDVSREMRSQYAERVGNDKMDPPPHYVQQCDYRIRKYDRMRIFHKLQGTKRTGLDVALIIKGAEILESAAGRRIALEFEAVGDAAGRVVAQAFKTARSAEEGAEFIFRLNQFLTNEPWKNPQPSVTVVQRKRSDEAELQPGKTPRKGAQPRKPRKKGATK